MTTPASPASPPPEATAKIIWFALLLTQFFYIGLLEMIHPPAQAPTQVVPALTAVAVLVALAAVIVDSVMLGEAPLDRWVAQSKAQGLSAQALREQTLARVFSMSIVSWALAESVTIMGLTLAITGQLSFNRFLLFVCGGVATQLYCSPKLARMREILDRHTA